MYLRNKLLVSREYAGTFDKIASTIGAPLVIGAIAIAIMSLPVGGIFLPLVIGFIGSLLLTGAGLLAVDGTSDLIEEGGGPYHDGMGDIFNEGP